MNRALSLAAKAAAIGAALLVAAPLSLAQQAPGPNAPQAPAPNAQQAPAPVQKAPVASVKFDFGFVSLADDTRHDPERAYYMVPVRAWGSLLDGAKLSVEDAQTIGKVIHVDFGLRSAEGKSIDELVDTVRGWSADGMNFVVADLPAAQLLALSSAVADLPMTILNISANEDTLRGANCRFNFVHIIPSYRMFTDAVVQFLVSKKWKNILVLQGPTPQDQDVVDAVRQSAAFFGARIVEVRPFVLSNDPRNREVSNVALLTAGIGYDVVYVADSDGEFARYAPYETNDPRPVVGSAGLVAMAWTWAYQRHGSSEVTYRFEQISDHHMVDGDWAAWVGIKAVVQSVLRSKSTDYKAVRDYLLGDKLNLDGGKGNPLSVRPWDHQVRQAIPLTTTNAVLEEAPITGFLHPANDLDTLGVDAPQSTCKF